MKTAKLGDYIAWKGQLVKVVAINPGKKSIIMETVQEAKCPHCEGYLGVRQFEVIEESPLFQENAQPIETLSI